MLFIGKYIDASNCYKHSKEDFNSGEKDNDFALVASIMKANYSNKLNFRIFFRFPFLPIISKGYNGNNVNDKLSSGIKKEILISLN